MVELVVTAQIYIFQNELGLAGCPPLIPFGVSMVGPVIYTFGNQEQKDRFLPDILNLIHGGVRVIPSQALGQILPLLRPKQSVIVMTI